MSIEPKLHGELFGMETGDSLSVSGGIRDGSLVYFARTSPTEWTIYPLAAEDIGEFTGEVYRAKHGDVDGEYAFVPEDLPQAEVQQDPKVEWLNRLKTDAAFASHVVEKFANPKDAPAARMGIPPPDTIGAISAGKKLFRDYFGEDFTDSPRAQ